MHIQIREYPLADFCIVEASLPMSIGTCSKRTIRAEGGGKGMSDEGLGKQGVYERLWSREGNPVGGALVCC